ncbi:hypothetical protein GOP47_0026929 [Adiantum capillus-veneris]|nr:hypothetical protein GOP47_0026381 [Adiantum capillus-veneris]KAI5058759.1 hypothetical protein GOP47_0026929 [Adiantum capillus-veneris]
MDVNCAVRPVCDPHAVSFTVAHLRPPLTLAQGQARYLNRPITLLVPSSLRLNRSSLVYAQHAIAPLRVVQQAFLQVPPSWTSSLIANATIFTLGFPILQVGLTPPGIAAAFLLGTSTWRAFGATAFLLVVAYFILGTAATKVKIQQKEKEGIAEKRSGKRGPSSVWGSGFAGMVCAAAAIIDLGGAGFFQLWQLGFVASFATKLSDTVSSEIGKAYGRSTYLVTTFKRVQRGTEGAVSLEGTFAGLVASVSFCLLAYQVHQVSARGAVMCVVASQLANLLESYAGATLQDKEGFEWLNNDLINVLNISSGAILAMMFQMLQIF